MGSVSTHNAGVKPCRKRLIKSCLCEEGNPTVTLTPRSSLAGFGKHPSCPGNDCSEQLYKRTNALRPNNFFWEGGWDTCPDVVLALFHFLLQLKESSIRHSAGVTPISWWRLVAGGLATANCSG